MPEVDPKSYVKFRTQVSRPLAIYVFVQFVVVLASTTLLLRAQDQLPRVQLLSASTLVVASLVIFGALFEGRRWAKAAEAVRAAALIVGAFLLLVR